MKDTGERALAVAIAGAGIFEIAKAYQSCVPSLHEITKASPDDDGMFASLVHADILAGGLALIAGGWLAFQMGSFTPLALALLVFGLVASWHHYAFTVETKG